MRAATIATAGLVSVLALCAGAEAQSQSMKPLPDFISAGRRNALSNRAASIVIDERDAERDESFYKLFPSLSASLSYTYNPYDAVAQINRPEGGTREVVIVPHHQFDGTVGLKVPLFDLEAIYRYRAAKSGHATARYDARANTQRVDGQVAKAYYQYLAASSILGLASDMRVAMGDLTKIAQEKATAGAVDTLDVERAQLESEQAQLAAAEAESMQAGAKRELTNLTGIDPGYGELASSELLEDDGPLAAWMGEVGGLPTVQAAASAVDTARENVAAANSRYLPKISAGLSDRLSNATGFQGQANTWTVGVTATIEFDLSRPATVRAQEAKKRGAEIKLAQARQDARETIQKVHEQVGVQTLRFKAAKARARLTYKALDLAEGRYAAGLGPIQDTIRARQEHFNAELARVQVFADLGYSKALLRIVSGKDLSGRSSRF